MVTVWPTVAAKISGGEPWPVSTSVKSSATADPPMTVFSKVTVGDPVIVNYLAAVGTNYAAAMAARVAVINARLVEAEQVGTISSTPAMLSLTEQDGSTFAHAFWRAVIASFNANDKVLYGRLLWWLYEMYLNGWITATQALNSFNASFIDASERARHIEKLDAVFDSF